MSDPEGNSFVFPRVLMFSFVSGNIRTLKTNWFPEGPEISERFRQFYFFTKGSTLLLEKSRKINFLHSFFIEQNAKLLPFLLILVG